MVKPKQFAEAVWAGDLPAVESMLADGADPNAADKDRWPPLHLAIEQQWLDIVCRLIAAGASVNRDLGLGWTPLAHAIDIESDAAWQRHHEPDRESTELLELLLGAGASPTEEVFQMARDYSNRRAIVVLERHAKQAEQNVAGDRGLSRHKLGSGFFGPGT